MGEGRESVQIEPTAEVKNSEVLDDELFFSLSQTIDGLSNIESDEVLADCALKRDNLEDVVYIYKFISNSEVFEILSGSTFEFLNEGEKKEACKIAMLYKEVLTPKEKNNKEDKLGNPSIFELDSLDINQEAVFIAYINRQIQGEMCEQDEGLRIAWKEKEDENKKKGKHLFDSLLRNTGLGIKDYPANLRSFGGIKIFKEGDIVKVRFFGDSEKKPEGAMPIYAPGVLKSFEPELEEIFQNKFPNMKVKIEF